jgi:hypothetical protein
MALCPFIKELFLLLKALCPYVEGGGGGGLALCRATSFFLAGCETRSRAAGSQALSNDEPQAASSACPECAAPLSK